MADSILTVPSKVTVSSIVSSRYSARGHLRPEAWDLRSDGVDIVRTEDGKTLRVWSDGGQSVPQPGWVIHISGGDPINGYHWTLFGMPKGVETHTY